MSALRSLSGPRRVAAVVVFVVLAAVGFLPLFGGPGYEQSLASGLVVPIAAAIATALELSREAAPAPVACVGQGIATGVMLALVAFMTALLHGLRVGICDFGGGAVFFLLTAGVGGMMGGAWGVVVAEACRGRRRRRLLCALLALAGPLGGIAVSLARFVGSPMIFMYDPFFGYFSGTLYDTVVDVRPELWSYRGGSIATLVGVALVAAALTRDAAGRLSLANVVGDEGTRRARLAMAGGVVMLAVSLAVTLEGPALGHWQTAATIARALGGRASGPRCDVVYPDSVPADEAALWSATASRSSPPTRRASACTSTAA